MFTIHAFQLKFIGWSRYYNLSQAFVIMAIYSPRDNRDFYGEQLYNFLNRGSRGAQQNRKCILGIFQPSIIP